MFDFQEGYTDHQQINHRRIAVVDYAPLVRHLGES